MNASVTAGAQRQSQTNTTNPSVATGSELHSAPEAVTQSVAKRPKDKSIRFWDWFAERYARTPIADEQSYQKKLEITRDYLSKDSRVFEFGCGTGSTALTHAEHVANIHAIDSSANMIAIANRKMAEAGIENVTFEQADIADVQDKKQAYDVILGLNILHLIENWRDVVHQNFEMLAPGGVYITSTACMTGGIRALFPLFWLGNKIGLIPKAMFFSRAALEQSVRDAGFTIEHSWQPGKGKAVFLVARKPVS